MGIGEVKMFSKIHGTDKPNSDILAEEDGTFTFSVHHTVTKSAIWQYLKLTTIV